MVFSTAFLLFACPSKIATAQSIQGQVIDSVDQRPLGGAFVYLIDISGNEVANTIADIEGNFVLVGQEPGSFVCGVEDDHRPAGAGVIPAEHVRGGSHAFFLKQFEHVIGRELVNA